MGDVERIKRITPDVEVDVFGATGKIKILGYDAILQHDAEVVKFVKRIVKQNARHFNLYSWGYGVLLKDDVDPEEFVNAVTQDYRENNASRKLLELADGAYDNGELRIAENIPASERGDGLATFIRNEILDVAKDHRSLEEAAQDIVRSLEIASRQLRDVIEEINELNFDSELVQEGP